MEQVIQEADQPEAARPSVVVVDPYTGCGSGRFSATGSENVLIDKGPYRCQMLVELQTIARIETIFASDTCRFGIQFESIRKPVLVVVVLHSSSLSMAQLSVERVCRGSSARMPPAL